MRHIGILIFVHMDIVEFIAVIIQHRRMIQEKLQRPQKKVVKIERVSRLETLLVLNENIVNLLRTEALIGGREPFIRIHHVVFRVRNLSPDFPGWKNLIIDIQNAQNILDHAKLVVVIINGKRALIAELFDIAPEHAHAHGMKRAQPHIPRLFAHQLFNALAHFTGSLVGERQGKNLICRHALFQ